MEPREDGLFSCWIEEVGEDIAFLQEFFARASDLGEAVAKVRPHLRTVSLSGQSQATSM